MCRADGTPSLSETAPPSAEDVNLMLSKALTLGLAALIAAACADPAPTAPDGVAPDDLGINAAVIYHGHGEPFEWELIWCGDHHLLQITEHIVERYTETPSGNINWGFQDNYRGTAVSLISGNEWKIRGHFAMNETLDPDGFPYTFKLNDTVILVGKGSAPNLVYQNIATVTVNGIGDVVVDRSNWFLKCPDGTP